MPAHSFTEIMHLGFDVLHALVLFDKSTQYVYVICLQMERRHDEGVYFGYVLRGRIHGCGVLDVIAIPELYYGKEYMSQWLEFFAFHAELQGFTQIPLDGSVESIDIEQVRQWVRITNPFDKGYLDRRPPPEPEPPEPTVVCVDNIGIEDSFDLNVAYVYIEKVDGDLLKVIDKFGQEKVCFADRFNGP